MRRSPGTSQRHQRGRLPSRCRVCVVQTSTAKRGQHVAPARGHGGWAQPCGLQTPILNMMQILNLELDKAVSCNIRKVHHHLCIFKPLTETQHRKRLHLTGFLPEAETHPAVLGPRPPSSWPGWSLSGAPQSEPASSPTNIRHLNCPARVSLFHFTVLVLSQGCWFLKRTGPAGKLGSGNLTSQHYQVSRNQNPLKIFISLSTEISFISVF